MKTSPLLLTRLSLSLILGPAALLAQEQAQKPATENAAETKREDPQAMMADIQREIAEIRRKIDEKVAAVDAAITKASAAGTLPASTATYYRDLLDRFRTPIGQLLPETERLYYPPRFDTSIEMEPINLAWADLKSEMEKAVTDRQRLASRVMAAVFDSLQAAAQTAEKPEDLNAVDKLLATARSFPDINRNRFDLYNSQADNIQRAADSMRAVLIAKQRGETERMIRLLQSFPKVHPELSIPGAMDRTSPQLRLESAQDTFRARMAEPFENATKAAQAELEKRFLARRPAAEIEEALADFSTKGTQAERISNRLWSRAEQSIQHGAVVGMYRSILDALSTAESGRAYSNFNPSPMMDAMGRTVSPAFRQFVSGLQVEMQKKQQEQQEKLEAERRAAAEAEQKRRQEEEAKRMAQEQQKARTAFAEAVEKTRQRIANIRTPEEALRAADEFPSLLPTVSTSSRYASGGVEGTGAWRQAEGEIRQIGVAWRDDAAELPPTLSSPGYDQNNSPFLAELRALRDRAARDVFARRFNTPALLQAPLAEMNTREAIEKLADDAAAKGDWQRCVELLQAVAPRTDYRGANSSRIQAIRSYLSALNFEQAGLYPEALSAYQMVLQQTVAGIPLKETAERVKKLRESHPEAFKTAVPSTEGTPAVPGALR